MASFSFGAGNAGKMLRIPLYLWGALVTAVVPRTRDLWVFGSASGLADGGWALWEHARARGERAVWLTSTAGEARAAQERGVTHVSKSSWRGFWITARAAVIVVTHGFGDVNRYAATGGVIVQLWHGIPLKRIGLDAQVTTASPLPFARSIASRALGFLYARTQARISLLPAASQLVRGRLESAFGLSNARVAVTGEPRTDALTQGTAHERRTRARDALERIVIIGTPSGATRAVGADVFALYAPTWRDGAPDPAPPTAADIAALHTLLEETGAVLFVRSHHLGHGDYASMLGERVRLLGSDIVADVTPLLAGMDALITDYSSIAYDAALVPVPTVFFAADLENYRRARGFYGRYEDVAGTDAAATWPEVTEQLRRILVDEQERTERANRARALSARVHDFSDGRSAERVYRTIRRLLSEPRSLSHSEGPQ